MRNIRQMRMWTARLGRAGERAAASMLRYRGFEILLRNCRMPRGEIDIVARDGFTLVFVEVKTLYARNMDARRAFQPRSNLSVRQKRRIIRGGLSYLRSLGRPNVRYRFDLVEILYTAWGPGSIRHHIGAFGYETVFKPVFH